MAVPGWQGIRGLSELRRWTWLCFLLSPLVLAGCSDGDEEGDDDSSTSEPATETPGDDDDSSPGDDDDSSPGDDDDSSPGDDDDSSPGDDDDSSPGDDDDSSPGDDDDSSPGDDTPVSVDADLDGYNADVDCNDDDSAVHPGATEVCDSQDNDCDQLIDETGPDADGDAIPDCQDSCSMDALNDSDADGVCGNLDNCPAQANADQVDMDMDDVGDVCDACPLDADDDSDLDGHCADEDNCPAEANADQNDVDGDAVGDVCDNCIDAANEDQADANQDGIGNVCDTCLSDPANDPDGDDVCSSEDNCPSSANSNQMDRDLDGNGDVCDVCPDDSPNANEDGTCGDDTAVPGADASFYIYGTIPDEGFRAVAGAEIEGAVYFSETYAGSNDKIHIRVVSQYGELQQLPPIFTSSDKTVANFYPELKADTDYCASIEVDYQSNVKGVWPVRYTSCFTTRVPCGVPINVGYNVVIEQIGDTSALGLRAINEALEPYNDFKVALLLEGIDNTARFPISVDAAYGGFESIDGANHLREEGYTTQLEGCTIDAAGNFNCLTDLIIFPVFFDGYEDGTYLYLEEGHITAKVQSSGNVSTMTGYMLEAIITEASLERIVASLSSSGYEFSNVVELDVDTNSDGINDAATFVLSTEPQPVTIVGAGCSAG